MKNINQLSDKWLWAKQNTNVCHDAVDRHINNMEDYLNRGFRIKPLITFDTHGTLIRSNPDETNTALFDMGKQLDDRDLVICSSVLSAALLTADELNFDPDNVFRKNEVSSKKSFNLWGRKTINEMLVDDEGLSSSIASEYASVVVPTWNKGLIAFPK